MRLPVLPERTPHDPQGRQTFLVSARILDDHRLDFLWMSQSHAESHWAAVVLHEECVVIQMHLVGEVLHYLRKMIKGVRKLLVVRPGGVTKPRIVRRDQVILFTQTRFQERLTHP